MDNRTDIVEQLDKSPDDVRLYLTDEFQKILGDRVIQEAVLGNLFYETREERYQRIIQCIEQLVNEV